MNVMTLYLLVETWLVQNSALAVELFSATSLSPVSTSSPFFQGHFHFRFLFDTALSLLGILDVPGKEEDPGKP